MKIIEFDLTAELVHRHLDWSKPLFWMGDENFLLIEENGNIQAVLICPENPPGAAWLRYFSVSDTRSSFRYWEKLWTRVGRNLSKRDISHAMVLPQNKKVEEMIILNGGELVNHVVTLNLDLPAKWKWKNHKLAITRKMLMSDLIRVEEIDELCFEKIWRLSDQELESAYQVSDYADVVENDGEIIGYQMSARSRRGYHLARLAVHPGFRRKGVARSLVGSLLETISQSGYARLTVNTQDDNSASKALYQSLGFKETSDIYPVYQMSTGGFITSGV